MKKSGVRFLSRRINRTSTVSSIQLHHNCDYVMCLSKCQQITRLFSDGRKDPAGDLSDSKSFLQRNDDLENSEVVTDVTHDPSNLPESGVRSVTTPGAPEGVNISNIGDNPIQQPIFSRSTHVVESIGSAVNATKQQAVNYTHEINRVYAEVEHDLMRRINEGNRRRFRLGLLSTLLFIVWVVSVFGAQIRKMLSDQTAGLAKETLENESLKVQTQELAMAVVQTVLNDKEVTAHAASFLREASVVPETQQALLALTLHVLQHPDSLKEFSILVKKLIEVVANDKETVRQVAGLLTDALEDPKLKAALGELAEIQNEIQEFFKPDLVAQSVTALYSLKLVALLFNDPEVIKMAAELTVKLLEEKEVIEATNKLLMTSTQTVLADNEVISQSKTFVTDVMGDDALQREGGDAIWNSVTHALKPGVIRILGFTLVCVSIAMGKVLLSPF